MNDSAKCPSCHNLNPKIIGAIPDSDYFAGRSLEYSLPGGCLYECNSCGLMFRFPLIEKELIDKLYREGKLDHWQHEEGTRIDWEIASKWIGSGVVNDVLDIGCFDGAFLSTLKSVPHCHGLEINKQAAALSQERGINIVGDDFLNIPIHLNFDAITSFDVIEHVPDPLSFLKKIASLTRDSGIVIISTGNTQAKSWRIMKSRYWYCTIPEHISFISPQWCLKNANSCGLQVASIELFSHASKSSSNFVLKLKQAIINLIYKFAPGVLAFARKLGFGGKSVSHKKELLQHPPTWMAAKDHFIVKFRKL